VLKEFKCEKTGIKFRSKDTDHDRSFRLRATLTKNKISIFKYLELWNIEHNKLRCAWCGDYNHDICGIEHTVNDTNIIPTGVRRRHTALYLCFSKHQCLGKKLNKNSVEFISKAYGLSESEALKKIHTRNSSPFYKINHQSIEDYKLSQSRSPDWFKKNKKDRQEWIRKANHSRSYQGYVEKNRGDEWKDIQKRKAITLSALIDKYGVEIGTAKYNQWKENTNLSLATFIKKFGKIQGTTNYLKVHINHVENTDSNDLISGFIKKVTNIVQRNPLYQYHMYNLEKELRFYKFYDVAKEFFELSLYDIEEYIAKILPNYRTNKRKIFRNNYSCYSYTDCGTILKSFYEIWIYDYLCKIGLKETEDFVFNQRYPNSELFYDIWFIHQNIYVEIAGGDSHTYKEHMLKKEHLFGSIIMDPNDYKTTISNILSKAQQ